MTISIIGFEGEVSPNTHVVWGAAALRVGKRVMNAVSRLAVPLERLDELVTAGALMKFAEPLELDESSGDPLWVLVVNTDLKYWNHFLVASAYLDDAKDTVIHRSQQDHLVISVFRNRVDIELYKQAVIRQILNHLLYQKAYDEDSLNLVRAGLQLDPNSLWLNAYRVHLSPASAAVERLARACLRGDDLEQFDKTLEALRVRDSR